MRDSKLLFLIFLVAGACNADEPDQPSAEFDVYLDRFVKEAKARGVTIDLSKVSINFVRETSPPGWCGYTDVDPVRIQIKQSDECWSGRTDIEKELLVFHELGHGILRRSHINDTLPNGDYTSIMLEGNQFAIYNEHTPEKRIYYLDELFKPLTPVPTWGLTKTVPTLIHSDTISSLNTWNFRTTNTTDHVGTTSDNHYGSPGHSLAIQSGGGSTEGFSVWSYNWSPTSIPVGSKVALRVKIRRDNLTGKGTFFALRGDAANGANFFVTTQGAKLIAGTQDFSEYQLILNYFPAAVTTMYIFLMLDGRAAGTVYFDDVTITSYL